MSYIAHEQRYSNMIYNRCGKSGELHFSYTEKKQAIFI